MGKYEIEMEITGFKLKVRGEREEDMPKITDSLRQQMSGLIQPASDIVGGRKQIESTVSPAPGAGNGNGNNLANRQRRTKRAGSPKNGDVPTVLSWAHDPDKWGNPKQAWTSWQKILWLMYVVDKERGIKELSGPSIADTFNTHFRQAGTLTKQNMPRDLGNLKQRTPPLVGDRADLTLIMWFLTEGGYKEAEKLVIDAKTPAPSE